MTARDAILARLDGEPFGVPFAPVLSPPMVGDAWVSFQKKLEEVGGRMATPSDLDRLKEKSIWVEAAAQKIVAASSTCDSIWDAELGISVAAFVIAETGSVVFETLPGSERLSSLIPPTNLVLVREIVPTLAEGIARMSDGNAVITTGTSRTADIEGVLVRGVHGPKELWVYRLGVS